MTSILENWIARITGLRVSLSPGKAGHHLHDGRIFYEILVSYNVIDIALCPPPPPVMSPAFDDQALVNLHSLAVWFKLVGVNFLTSAALEAIASKDDTASLRLLFELHARLENTGGMYLVTEQDVLMGSPGVGSRCVESGRFQVARVDEPEELTKHLPRLPNYFELEEPLRAQGITVQKYREFLDKAIGNSKEAMKKRRMKLMTNFPDKEPIIINELPKPSPASLLSRIDEFEKLLTVIPGEERDFRVNSDEYVKYLKSQRSSSRKNAIYENKMKKKLMNTLNQDLERRNEEGFQKVLLKIMSQECHYEKNLRKRLLQLHGMYKHLINIEERVEQLAVDGSKLIDERKHNRFTARQRQEWRVRELHAKIWEKRQRTVKEEGEKIASSTLQEIVNLAMKYCEYVTIFRVQPDPKLFREWKELFFKNFPVFHEPRSFMETRKIADETIYLSDRDKNTQTINSEAQCTQEEECGLDLAMEDCLSQFNMKTYLNQEYEWKFSPPGAEKFRLIGNIAHRLLDIKYPLPSLPSKESIPKLKLKVLLGPFQDNCSPQVFSRLSDFLAKSKVELFDVNMAINFCLNAYLKEKGVNPPGSLIKYNFVENEIKRRNDLKNEIQNRYKRRKVREPESVFKAVTLTAADDQILVGGKEGRHKATQCPSTTDLFSQRTIAGQLGKMAFEILSTGAKLNDVLICCMIVEFLKSLKDRIGFVLVNYPRSEFQAHLLEFIMSGMPFKMPQTATQDEARFTEQMRAVSEFNVVKERCLDNKIHFIEPPVKKKVETPEAELAQKKGKEIEEEEGIEPTGVTMSTQTELIRRAIDFDQLRVLRQSEIVPKITCAAPQYTSKPFFDKYVKFLKVGCNAQESQFIEPLMIPPTHAMYEKLQLVEVFDYARFDTPTEKRLARVILNEPWEESDVQRKTSNFLFGKELLDNTENYNEIVLSSSESSESDESIRKEKQKKGVVVKYKKYDPIKPIKKTEKPPTIAPKPVEVPEEKELKLKKKSISSKSVAKSGSRKSVARKSVSRKSVSRKSVSRKSVAKSGGSRKSLKRKSVAKGARKSLAKGSQGGSKKESTMQRGSFYRETTGQGGPKPPSPVKKPKIHPNDPNWTLLCESLEETVALEAATLWEIMEYTYLTGMEKIFYLIRQHDKKVLPHLTELTQELQTNLSKDNVIKQHLVTNLQLALNSIEQEFRRDPELKSEFHFRVGQLKRTLSRFTYDNLQQLNAHRLDLISKNWTSDHFYALSDLYLSLVQMELDRFVDTLQVLTDYYFSMAHAIPDPKRLSRITVKRLHEMGLVDEIQKIYEGVKELLSGAQPENIEGIQDDEEVAEETFSNPAHEFFTRPIAEVLSSLEGLAGECKPMINHKDVENGLTGKVRQIEVEDNPGQPNSQKATFDYEILDDAKNEWSTAVDNEVARAKFRLNLIQDRAKIHSDQILKRFKEVFDGFQEASEQRAVREWSAEANICYFFQRAIEEETGIQPLMVIDGDRFYINREINLYPDPPPLPPTSIEEIVSEYSFTITQLYSLVAKFKLMAPSGMLDVPLFQAIQEMVMSGVESGHQCLPTSWRHLTGVDIRNIFTRAFGDQTWIDWRDFVIYCSRIQYPTIDELLEVQSKFREIDQDGTELISFDDYFPVMLWFEKDFGASLKDDLRAALAKELIFEMFKIDDNTINFMDMCLAWCKDDKAEDGFVMALELYKDSGFLLPPEVCYRDDEMGDIHPRKIVDWWINIFMNDTLTLTEELYLKRLERMTNREVYASEDNQLEMSEDILKSYKGRIFDDASSSEEDEIIRTKDLTNYLIDDEEVEAKYVLPAWNHCVPFEISLALFCRALYFATSPIHHHQILGIEQRLSMLYKDKGVGNFVKAHVLGRSDIFKEFVSKTNIFKKCDALGAAEEIIRAKNLGTRPPE